jgi:hypothetical protein
MNPIIEDFCVLDGVDQVIANKSCFIKCGYDVGREEPG